MHIVAIHETSDPEKFWATAQEVEIPSGMTLHSTLPNEDGTRAVCVWEAESTDAVSSFIDEHVGEISRNDFYEVNSQNAQGLPG
jgi:hypothetical protein